MRIKEILKEKNMTVQELADKMNVSRQALSRQINGKLLVETAQNIADALEVPLWQLFEGSQEQSVSSSSELVALIRNRGQLYQASTIEELESLIEQLKEGK